ncbi:MAG: ABC transporter ATP-binding protein [Nocardioidaceae bacterium]|uniref:NitT/TauT family transport system ATP-binding protein n=1 Tax=Janibacter cremeus TaxID=1285192 RepID=A0A852VX13_9MICO|nr:ABC transporter ATP-binding protein [Janibacter cremeus]MDN5746616.1 ABC transporter ATP-binding protein [Nocardioidaceae bacterium]NYF98071.1 NitT/TauT family transport system ATP-binding protein [Janibacter cremeus]
MTDTSQSPQKIVPELQLDGVSKRYGDNLAVRSISAMIPAHKISVIVGPSGCGKSTLLRIISGLDDPTDGTVTFEGTTVSGVPEGLAMVFQDYSRSLYPWMRVDKNVAFPLSKVPKKERAERVQEALDAVGLGDRSHLYPWQMSGGMQQRVAIARALASRPKLLVMDEPYASVDAQTRADLEDLLLRIQRKLGITVLVVTHDIDESVYLADHIIVLSTPPSIVAETIEVDLPHPRDHVTTKTDPRYVEIRGHVTQLLRHRELQAVEDAS